MFENLEEIYKKRQKIEEDRLTRLETLYRNRDKIRERFFKGMIGRKEDRQSYYNFSVAGVDSAYTMVKRKHGGVDYFWAGVGYNQYDFYYASDIDVPEGFFEYAETELDSNFLLSGMGSLIELRIASRLGRYVKYVFLDGSLFTALLNIFRAYNLSVKLKEEGRATSLVDDILERYREVHDELIVLLEAGSLYAFPKRASRNELVQYVSRIYRKPLSYRDAEFVDILLEPGEYINITSMVDRGALKEFLSSYSRNLLSEKLREILENVSIFYVKGEGGGVIRVESFSSTRLPVELIYSQNITNSNELQVIIEADRLAKEMLKLFLLSEPDLFGNYRV